MTKTHVSNLMHFQDKGTHLFFLKNKGLRNENVNLFSVFIHKMIIDVKTSITLKQFLNLVNDGYFCQYLLKLINIIN